MADWLTGGRGQSQRLEGLERDVQRISSLIETVEAMALANANQATALNLATAELERLRNLPTAMLELETRLAELEDIAGPERIRSVEERAKSDEEAMTKLRAALRRAELQLEIYAEEGRKTGAALFERIESLRSGQPVDLRRTGGNRTGE